LHLTQSTLFFRNESVNDPLRHASRDQSRLVLQAKIVVVYTRKHFVDEGIGTDSAVRIANAPLSRFLLVTMTSSCVIYRQMIANDRTQFRAPHSNTIHH
jgi:hypothetical protein